jgi:hypothetical protein
MTRRRLGRAERAELRPPSPRASPSWTLCSTAPTADGRSSSFASAVSPCSTNPAASWATAASAWKSREPDAADAKNPHHAAARPTAPCRTTCWPPAGRGVRAPGGPSGTGADAAGRCCTSPGSQLRHAYFPTTAIVSLHYVTESGASAETAGVGNEGVVGVSLFMGGDTTPSSAVVQTAGSRLPAGPPLC